MDVDSDDALRIHPPSHSRHKVHKRHKHRHRDERERHRPDGRRNRPPPAQSSSAPFATSDSWRQKTEQEKLIQKMMQRKEQVENLRREQKKQRDGPAQSSSLRGSQRGGGIGSYSAARRSPKSSGSAGGVQAGQRAPKEDGEESASSPSRSGSGSRSASRSRSRSPLSARRARIDDAGDYFLELPAEDDLSDQDAAHRRSRSASASRSRSRSSSRARSDTSHSSSSTDSGPPIISEYVYKPRSDDVAPPASAKDKPRAQLAAPSDPDASRNTPVATPAATAEPPRPASDAAPAAASAPFASPLAADPLIDSLPPYFPAIQGCRSVEEFKCLNKIEEGTYGVVYRACEKKTGEMVALKRLKMEKEKEGFPITSLREINTLLKAQHENIVTVREIVVGSNMDRIYMVMDYVEHDLKALIESMKEPFLVGEVKTLLRQLLRAVHHLHDNWILHRDLKTSNLLLTNKGILKVADFGLAREYGSPLKAYTPVVVTLWYRSPELLLGTKMYSTAVDMWSVGCIMAELLLMKPLWRAKSEIEELSMIFKDLGTPNETIWPGCKELPGMKKCNYTEYRYNKLRDRFGHFLSDEGFNLMNKFFMYDPARRVSAQTALTHRYFSEEPLPVPPEYFPSWPPTSEGRKSGGGTPKPPSAGKGFYAKLLGDADDDEKYQGFHMTSSTQPVKPHGFSLKF